MSVDADGVWTAAGRLFRHIERRKTVELRNNVLWYRGNVNQLAGALVVWERARSEERRAHIHTKRDQRCMKGKPFARLSLFSVHARAV